MTPRIERIVLCGDTVGIPQLLSVMPREVLCGLIGAEIRPHCHAELSQLADALGLPFLVQVKAASPRYAAFVEEVRALRPDLIMVNSYSMLVREEILSIPACGSVNIHAGLLPSYRGCNPTQWALLNNETETGVTMHYMTPAFDTGDIIAQRRVPILLGDTWREIQQRLNEATASMLREELPKLLAGTNQRVPQDDRKARHYARRRPEDGKFDWDARVIDIYNLIRALVRPHPGAFCLQNGDKRVFDEYLTLQEVAGLKFGALGRQRLETGHVRLEPFAFGDTLPLSSPPSREESKEQVVAFRGLRAADGRGLCTVVLEHFDYLDRTCNLLLRAREGSPATEVSQATRLALEFAARELGLARVAVHIDTAALATVDLLQGVGESWERLPHVGDAVVLMCRG